MDLCRLQTKFSMFRVSQTNKVIDETPASTVFHHVKSMMANPFF